jgi:hypothetical protein
MKKYLDKDFSVSRIPNEMLNVNPHISSTAVRSQALDIAGWTKVANTDCFVIMQHEPSQETLNDLYDFCMETCSQVAIIGGELSLMTHLIPLLSEQGIYSLIATTERVVEEIPQEDGTTVTKRTFKYVQLRCVGGPELKV